MTIGFRTAGGITSAALGELSGFNIWGHPLSVEEVMRMSQGCGAESGDVKAWRTVRRGITKNVEVVWSRSCTDSKGW